MISNISSQTPSTIEIESNLTRALKHLRYANRSRTLWNDALSINQKDISERGAQVKRVGKIHSLADRVVIWIGQQSNDSTPALSMLERFGEQVEYLVDGYYGDAPGAAEPDWWDPEVPLLYDEKIWSAIISLFKRPWYSRIWILQEVLLANQYTIVQCDDHFYSWLAI